MAVNTTNYAKLTAELAMNDGDTKKISLFPFSTDSSAVSSFKANVMQYNDDNPDTRPSIVGTKSTNGLRTGNTFPGDCPIVSATIETIKKTSIYQSQNAALYAKKGDDENGTE